MWSRDSWVEPEAAKETLATVSHAVEVSLTHFFSRSGVILLPSSSRCEAMPLLQLCKKTSPQEAVISGVLFPLAETSGDCVAVMLSEAISNRVVGTTTKWDYRLQKLKDGAIALVEPIRDALDLPSWTEPSFIFDMQAAALQAIAAHASETRTTAVVLSVHLNGLDKGEWAHVVAILSADQLDHHQPVRRAS